MAPRYILLVTDEDGSETAWGPFTASVIDRRAEHMAQAFPEAHVRALMLLTLRASR